MRARKSMGRLEGGRRRFASYSTTLGVMALVIPTQEAMAYVDPNIAGWLFQILLPLFAAVLGVWAFIRNRFVSAWRRMLAVFTGRPVPSAENDTPG